MERTIRVTGKGKIAIKPDLIRLYISQQEVLDSYDKAIEQSADKKGLLNERLMQIGFEKTDLKTLSFNVDTEYQDYQVKDKSWKRRLVGYRYSHRMKLEFPADNDQLGKVLAVIAHCPGHPEFSIEYTVSNKESVKNELLSKAIEDSKGKAEVLAKAAGVQLYQIQTIDYSWSEVDFVSKPVNDMMLMTCCEAKESRSIHMDIEADDIDVTDTVTVIWTIQ